LEHARQQARQLPRLLADRLVRAGANGMRRQGLLLDVVQQRLQAQDPQRVLQRGYAWVQTSDGRPVLSVRALRQGQAVRAVWADGSAQAEVLKVEPLLPTP
jgi:exodeoxyribonuclease VII large subunit